MHSKGNYKQDEETTSEWEKIKANETTDKRLISKIYKQLMQLNIRKTNNPIKSGQKTYTDISPKKTYRWLINTRKDAQHCLLLDKRNNENYKEISPHTGHHQKIYKQ